MRRKGRERLPEPRGPEGAEGEGPRPPTRGVGPEKALQQRVPELSLERQEA